MPSPQVTIDEGRPEPPPIAPAPTGVTAFAGNLMIGPVNTPVACRSMADFERSFGPCEATWPTSLQVRQFFDNGGSEARICRTPPALPPGDAAVPAALIEDFDLLCAPDLAGLAGAAQGAAVASLLALVRERRAFLLLDPPADGADVSGVRAWRSGSLMALGESLKDAAVHFPRVMVASGQGGTVALGPSGTMAGILARTDRERGVWKAPSGTPAGVTALEKTLSSGEQGLLPPEGINLLRSLPGRGLQVSGARTLGSGIPSGTALAADSDKYIPGRRLTLMIERSLLAGLRWAVFEPNGQPLWAALRRTVEAFLYALWRDGAFQGVKPELGYFCRCDRTTMAQADIDQGVVRVLVGFAAVRPGEFTIVRIDLKTAGAA